MRYRGAREPRERAPAEDGEQAKSDEATPPSKQDEDEPAVPRPPRGLSAVVVLVLRLFSHASIRRQVALYSLTFVAGVCAAENAKFFVEVKVFAGMSKALEAGDAAAFHAWLPYMSVFLIFGLCDVVARGCKWVIRKRFVLQLRMELCRALFSPEGEPDAQVFYRLHYIGGTSTPEHQIVDDLREMSNRLNDHFFSAVQPLMTLALTAFHLYGGHRTIFLLELAAIPVSMSLTSWLAPRLLTHSYERKEQVAATMRALLGRVQNHVESIALFQGGSSELQRYDRVNDAMLQKKETLNLMTAVVVMVNEILSNLPLLVPCLWLLRRVLDGSAAVSESLVVLQLLYDFRGSCMIAFSMPQNAVMSGVPASRCLQLFYEADFIHEEARRRRRIAKQGDVSGRFIVVSEHEDAGAVPVAAGPVLELQSVTLRSPTAPGVPGQVIVEDLTLVLARSESCLIVGDSGKGKSAVLAAIQGLWSTGRGHVRRCRSASTFCVPQQPYMLQGTLREQLTYPSLGGTRATDDELWGVLKSLNLMSDLGSFQLDDVYPWEDILSLGQQQRISIARALVQDNIQLLLLDDCTSALDIPNERRAYSMIRRRVPCYVSAGHRPSVRRYHTHILSLPGGALTSTPSAAADAEEGKEEDRPVHEGESRVQATQGGRPTSEGSVCGSGGERDVIPVESLSIILRCLLGVMWPIFTRRPTLWRLLRLLAASLILVQVQNVFNARVAEKYGALIGVLQGDRKDDAWGFISQNCWCLLAKWLMMFLSVYCHGRITIYMCEMLRKGIATYYLGTSGAVFYQLHTAGMSGSPGDMVTEIAGFDCEVVGQGVAMVALGLAGFMSALAVNMGGVLQAVPKLGLFIVAWSVCYCAFVSKLFLWPAMLNFSEYLHKNTHVRNGVARVVSHANSVALMRGGSAEFSRHGEQGAAALQAVYRFMFSVDALQGADFLAQFAVQAATMSFIGQAILSGSLSFAEGQAITMKVFTTTTIVRELLKMVTQAVPVFGAAQRIQAFVVTAKEVAHRTSAEERKGILLEEPCSSDVTLELQDLALKTPEHALGFSSLLLMQGVSLRLQRGESLLIAGESGLGKSSLVRAISGLWSNGSGSIRRPAGPATFFVSQRPYLCLGSLREQVMYPSPQQPASRSDDDIRAVLVAVNLGHLLKNPGLDAQCPGAGQHDGGDAALDVVGSALQWTGQLSLGEMQRLSFARLLLQRGLRLVLLDEGTAAMDAEQEAEMYRLVQPHVESYVSVAHRPQLRKFHSHAFVLTRQAGPRDGPAAAQFLTMPAYEQDVGAAEA